LKCVSTPLYAATTLHRSCGASNPQPYNKRDDNLTFSGRQHCAVTLSVHKFFANLSEFFATLHIVRSAGFVGTLTETVCTALR
jgi:hypothetical protein